MCGYRWTAPPSRTPRTRTSSTITRVGLRVEAADGTLLGTVARIDHAPASDLIVLDKTGGRTGLIPFVAAMVPAVDLAGGRLIVDLPEGLLDL